MCIYVGVKEHVNVCMQRTEVDIRCLSQSFLSRHLFYFTLFVCVFTYVFKYSYRPGGDVRLILETLKLAIQAAVSCLP